MTAKPPSHLINSHFLPFLYPEYALDRPTDTVEAQCPCFDTTSLVFVLEEVSVIIQDWFDGFVPEKNRDAWQVRFIRLLNKSRNLWG